MSRPLRRVLIAGAAGVTAYVLAVQLVTPDYHHTDPAGLAVGLMVGLSFLITGIVAWQRQPRNRTGLLMTWVGYAWFSETIGYLPSPLAFTVGDLVLQTVYLPAVAHLAMAYPWGRLRNRLERAVLALAYIVDLGGAVLRSMFQRPTCGGCPDLLFVRAEPALARTLGSLTSVAGLALALTVLAILAAHWLPLRGAVRRVTTPVLWSAGPIAAFAVVSMVDGALGRPLDRSLLLAGYLALVLLPIGFVVGMFRAKLIKGTLLASVLDPSIQDSPEQVGAALAVLVGDPTMRVRTGSPHPGDPAGRVVLSAPGADRLVTLVHDPSLDHVPELVAPVSDAIRRALDRRDRIAAERAARQQTYDLAHAVRRGLALDVHDSVQRPLLFVAGRLRQIRTRLEGGDLAAATLVLAEAENDVREALAEMRNVAHGIHPVVLTQSGLAAALESLAEAAPMPMNVVTVPSGRYGESVEAAAYYIVVEAVANAVKHSRAESVEVSIVETQAPEHLRIDIRDRGVGGATLGGGTGLLGMRDRATALGGELHLSSPAGGGTEITVRLPLA